MFRRVLIEFGKRAALLNGLVGWTVFWGLVVRLHVLAGDLVGITLTGAIAVMPIVGILLWFGYHGVQNWTGIDRLRDLFASRESSPLS